MLERIDTAKTSRRTNIGGYSLDCCPKVEYVYIAIESHFGETMVMDRWMNFNIYQQMGWIFVVLYQKI